MTEGLFRPRAFGDGRRRDAAPEEAAAADAAAADAEATVIIN